MWILIPRLLIDSSDDTGNFDEVATIQNVDRMDTDRSSAGQSTQERKMGQGAPFAPQGKQNEVLYLYMLLCINNAC